MPNNTTQQKASTASEVENKKEEETLSLKKEEANKLKLALAIGGLAGIVSHSKNPLVLGIGLVISSCACLWAYDCIDKKEKKGE